MERKKYDICNIILDEKFIDDTIDGMDLFSDRWNTVWVICSDRVSGNSFKYIKKHTDRIEILPEGNIPTFIQENNFDAVILHSLYVVTPSTILKVHRNVLIFWFSWGYDIYNWPINRPYLKWNEYKPLTAKYINKSLKRRLYFLKIKTKYSLKRYGKKYLQVLNRIDYFAGFPFEYNLLKQIHGFKARKVTYTYSKHSLFDSYEDHSGNNILVGHSAACANNHLDVLEYLKNVDLNSRKIVLPLSYGDSYGYANHILETYSTILGNKIVALKDFMPYDEYKKCIKSCGIAVFCVKRNLARGNINAALMYGCKVFLSEENPFYKYFRDLGIHLFSLEKDFNNDNINTPLTTIEIEQNRSILKKLYDKDAYIEELNSIYNALSSPSLS